MRCCHWRRALLGLTGFTLGLAAGPFGHHRAVIGLGLGTGWQRWLSWGRGWLGAVLAAGLGAGKGGGHGCLGGVIAAAGLLALLLGLLVASFALLLFPLQPLLAGFKALTRLLRLANLLIGGADLGFGHPVVVNQRNSRRADVGAGATLDAVEQVVLARLVVILAAAVPKQLLWQQLRRADLGTGTAADTGLGIAAIGQLATGRGQDAVADLDHRDLGVGQGEAHHRPAHDHLGIAIGLPAHMGEQMTHLGAQWYPVVTGLGNGATTEGDQPLDQWFTVIEGAFDGKSGADVLHQDADVGRIAATGHLAASKQLHQLAFAAGGVFGWHHAQLVGALAERGAQGSSGLGLIVFNRDQHQLGLGNVGKNIDTTQDLAGVVAHQRVVAADIGFALDAVDDQQLGTMAEGQLTGGREAGAAKAGDTGRSDGIEQRPPLQGQWVLAQAAMGVPLVQTIGIENQCRFRQRRGVGAGPLLNGGDSARGGGM